MKVNQAANIQVTFLSLIMLTRHDEVHSHENIQNTINYENWSTTTVKDSLQYLEEVGAIVCNYPKEQRQGQRAIKYELYPLNIPQEVYGSVANRSTLHRWKQKFVDKGLAYYENGELLLNGEVLLTELGDDFINLFKRLFKFLSSDSFRNKLKAWISLLENEQFKAGYAQMSDNFITEILSLKNLSMSNVRRYDKETIFYQFVCILQSLTGYEPQTILKFIRLNLKLLSKAEYQELEIFLKSLLSDFSIFEEIKDLMINTYNQSNFPKILDYAGAKRWLLKAIHGKKFILDSDSSEVLHYWLCLNVAYMK
ncbi:MAG: hypothetical protein Phog2KO_26340 [Phototrophicaceae bacterium]